MIATSESWFVLAFRRETETMALSMKLGLSEGVAVALIGGVGILLGAWIDASWHQRENNERMVGFAIDVLKSDCKTAPGLVPARRWAVAVISRF